MVFCNNCAHGPHLPIQQRRYSSKFLGLSLMGRAMTERKLKNLLKHLKQQAKNNPCLYSCTNHLERIILYNQKLIISEFFQKFQILIFFPSLHYTYNASQPLHSDGGTHVPPWAALPAACRGWLWTRSRRLFTISRQTSRIGSSDCTLFTRVLPG